MAVFVLPPNHTNLISLCVHVPTCSSFDSDDSIEGSSIMDDTLEEGWIADDDEESTMMGEFMNAI
jgi:hypothetical protein